MNLILRADLSFVFSTPAGSVVHRATEQELILRRIPPLEVSYAAIVCDILFLVRTLGWSPTFCAIIRGLYHP